MSPMWEYDWHCGNFSIVQRDFRAARRQPWNSHGSTAHPSVPEMAPAVWILRPDASTLKDGNTVFFSLFHKGNFCPFHLTIFILYPNHAELQVDACEILSSLKDFAVAHQHQQNPWQTCMPSETQSKCKDKSPDGPYTPMSTKKKKKKKIQEEDFWSRRHLQHLLYLVLTFMTHSQRRHLCRLRNSGTTIGKA